MPLPDNQAMDRIARQNVEFDAVTKLSEQWAVLRNVPVVDDDYPFYRHRYETAVSSLIEAFRTNGRIK